MGTRVTIHREEVERVARLASLAVDEGTLAALTQQISNILEYVSQLDRMVTDADTSAAIWLGLDAPLPPRADQVRPANLHHALKDLAPAFREGLFLVPRLPGLEDQ
ncbi:MAG TPA: aspartyl/glutamyl-tRNA amidotransferase subunit C [Gemmatimonadales bacterium]|jgi:aspartyl/glutamyl-tRNA(Asn/Gln) amidotransferase C subunit